MLRDRHQSRVTRFRDNKPPSVVSNPNGTSLCRIKLDNAFAYQVRGWPYLFSALVLLSVLFFFLLGVQHFASARKELAAGLAAPSCTAFLATLTAVMGWA